MSKSTNGKEIRYLLIIVILFLFACNNNYKPKDEPQGIVSTNVKKGKKTATFIKAPSQNKGKKSKALNVKITAGTAPLVDSCCTFGAVGENLNDSTVHLEFTQIKTLQEGETFQWIFLMLFPPNAGAPVIFGVYLVPEGTTEIVLPPQDYTPDLGTGDYTFRLTGSTAAPFYRPIGSNDVILQVKFIPQ